jgi:hypothetical protein
MKFKKNKENDQSYSFQLPCRQKQMFATEALALTAADFHMLENMSIELDVYRCEVCLFWHLTTKK